MRSRCDWLFKHSRAPVLRKRCGQGFAHSRASFAFGGLRASENYGSVHGVSQPPKPRRPGPPHNRGVRELVESKRRWSSPSNPEDAKQGFRGWNERGYLPHCDEPGLTQFVTFRLADSFPESLRSEWGHLRNIEDDRERREGLEAYLDKGRGECHLRRPEIAKLVEDAVRFFHGERYDLRAWVVMPNHVHALFKVDATPMARILESWKKHTANKANRLLDRRGEFWQADYWDTIMRDSGHELETRNYIEKNPARAGLVLDLKSWPWSSARFRDELGVLKL
jgi:REP element-mobilizing transposase RayT